MNIGFIGAGKMAQAIARGLCQQGGYAPENIWASARQTATLETFRSLVAPAVRVTEDNSELIRNCLVVFLAVKPQGAQSLVPALEEALRGRLVVSVMAGITLGTLETWLGPQARVVRTMPNSPCLIGQGVTGVLHGAQATAADQSLVAQLLCTVGEVVNVSSDSELDAVTAVSGSGPAYVYHFIDELIQAGVEQGLTPSVARQLAVRTVIGAAAMVQGSAESPLELAARVKSPQGTTLAACTVLENRGWGGILREAVSAARRRAAELSRDFAR